MPTALMENLLDGGRKNKQIPTKNRGEIVAEKAAWCLDDEDEDDDEN